MAAVLKNYRALKFASPALRADRRIVEVAVATDGEALEYASDDLKANYSIVEIAIANKGNALTFASSNLQNDPDLLAMAVRNGYDGDGFQIRTIDKRLQHVQDYLSQEEPTRALRLADPDARFNWAGFPLFDNEESVRRGTSLLTKYAWQKIFLAHALQSSFEVPTEVVRTILEFADDFAADFAALNELERLAPLIGAFVEASGLPLHALPNWLYEEEQSDSSDDESW